MCFSIHVASSLTKGFWPWLPWALAKPERAIASNNGVCMIRALTSVQLGFKGTQLLGVMYDGLVNVDSLKGARLRSIWLLSGG